MKDEHTVEIEDVLLCGIVLRCNPPRHLTGSCAGGLVGFADVQTVPHDDGGS
jgi:hypothetical protein